jgi:hypothetical protein
VKEVRYLEMMAPGSMDAARAALSARRARDIDAEAHALVAGFLAAVRPAEEAVTPDEVWLKRLDKETELAASNVRIGPLALAVLRSIIRTRMAGYPCPALALLFSRPVSVSHAAADGAGLPSSGQWGQVSLTGKRNARGG